MGKAITVPMTKPKNRNRPGRYPCHCCHKKDTVYWSADRQHFICENCRKSFDRAVIAKRHGSIDEQMTLC